MPRILLTRAFTIIELLVVVVIVALLVSVLLPSLSRARQQASGAVCLSNLHQFVLAAQVYTQLHRDRYPIAQYTFSTPDRFINYKWDFITTMHMATFTLTVQPGLLWMGRTNPEIHQCPLFKGNAMSPGDPFTGYNYNTSYIGHGQGEVIEAPITSTQVRLPPECALFGDGQYAAGANKYMRSPWKDPKGGGDKMDFRTAGTQGYRHLDKTNVAFCDGHAAAWNRCCTDNSEGKQPAKGTGFLSPDNRPYDPLARAGHPPAATMQQNSH